MKCKARAPRTGPLGRDISHGERAAIEQLLGKPLGSDQTLFIMALSAGVASEAERTAARTRLQQHFQPQEARKLDASEADATVEKAMRHVRQQATARCRTRRWVDM